MSINIGMPKRETAPDNFSAYNKDKLTWTHDVTGEIYKFWSEVQTDHPAYSMCWCEGEFGAYLFTSEFGSFEAEEGVRGIGYKAILAFDSNGKGIIFIKD